MKLFAVYVGGEMPAQISSSTTGASSRRQRSRTPVTHAAANGGGKPDSLHIDGWAETDPVDGQDIEPRREPFAGSDRLERSNLGGDVRGDVLDRHRTLFVVAHTPTREIAGAPERRPLAAAKPRRAI